MMKSTFLAPAGAGLIGCGGGGGVGFGTSPGRTMPEVWPASCRVGPTLTPVGCRKHVPCAAA